jgi:plastocyanin
MQFTVLTTAFFAGLAAAANHVVKVGESGLTFSPNSLNASKGDTVTFHFYPKNHNVVQAAFASPCQPLSGGFYSGFHATSSGEANTTFMITVQDTKPIWFYCSQGQHCAKIPYIHS